MISIIKKVILIVPLILSWFSVVAQMGVEDGSRYGKGEDSIHCIQNLSLYREFVKQGPGRYQDAIGSWRIVFKECPTSSQNIYIDGIKIYNDLIDKETDAGRKALLMDTLRMIYDQRIKYFKQPGTVLGREGVDILRHPEYRRDLDIVEEAYGYLKQSVDIQKNNSAAAVLATYMTSTIYLYQNERLTDMQVIDNYALTSDILDYKLARNPGDNTLLRVMEANDNNFIASGAPTCESLINYFQPDYNQRSADPLYLRRAVKCLSAVNCEEDPFYAKAAEALYTIEPSPEAAFGLAKLFVTKKEYDKATGYYREAIDNEEDPVKKSEYYYQLAYITNTEMDQPRKARDYALEALKLRPDWGDPYILIGDAYAAAKDCFEDDFEKTTIYWAAVDKYNQAKSVDDSVTDKANERINTYRKYFPDVETIFFYSLNEGDSYTVGCWINEKTEVRAR